MQTKNAKFITVKKFNFTTIHTVVLLSIITFLLHIIWENTQAPFFAGYKTSLQHFSLCLLGTTGDVFITLVVFVLFALVKNNLLWIDSIDKKDLFVLGTIGLFISIGIEYRALHLDKWSYANAMPIIPFLKIGFTPVLQMIILLPFSFSVVKKLHKK